MESRQIAAAEELKAIEMPKLKPGIKTTEFWLAALAALIGFLYSTGLIETGSPLDRLIGVLAIALGSLGYSIGRGNAKRTVVLLACALFVCVGLTGCVNVPANKIKITGQTGTYEIEAPKNVNIENFKASVATNGTLNIEVAKWSATNDPQVISRSAAGQAAVVNAYGNIITNAVAAGMKAAATAAP